jgi:hypothetical protein
LIICEILSVPDDVRRKELLEVLYNLHLWRGTSRIDRQIVEGLGHLAVMSGLSMPTLAKLIAEYVWQMCWHFVGPHQTNMDRNGIALVLRCADITESLASYNCLLQQHLGVLKTTLGTAENLFDVALWYKNEQIAKAILIIYKEAETACEEFSPGLMVLRRSAKGLTEKLNRSGVKWPMIARRLGRYT